jgi:hypothetical protein
LLVKEGEIILSMVVASIRTARTHQLTARAVAISASEIAAGYFPDLPPGP